MFLFSICETVFMSSMAMSYFYSWQTYSVSQDSLNRKSHSSMSSAERDKQRPEVVEVGFRDVLFETIDDLQVLFNNILQTELC